MQAQHIHPSPSLPHPHPLSPKMTHALVLGASGLIGWSVVAQLLSGYPSSGTFTRITAVTNRPLSLEESFWPTPNADGPTLELVSGVDLTKSEEEVEEMLKKVQGIEGVRVVFYFGAYKSKAFYLCRFVHVLMY